MAVTAGEKPTSITDLQPKMALAGKVKKVELFGAFVDVGVGQDGLLHISQLSTKRVRNVTDIVNEGDEVNVWVVSIDTEKKRFNLTLVEPAALSWDEISEGDVLTGTVARVEKYGAFINVGAERNGRVHVSEMANEFVKDPNDIVSEGDEIQVKVISVNPRKRQIDLSMKALLEPVQSSEGTMADLEDEEETFVPTAMELALRQAMEGTDLEGEVPARRKSKRRGKKVRRQQEDILARTLQHRSS